MPSIDAFRPAGSTAALLFDLVVTALGSLAMVVGAWLSVPLPGTDVPMTLQTVAVMVAGGWLGPRRGAFAGVGYLLLGGFGFPVFAGGKSGWSHLVGSTSGYLIGFVIAAGVCGALCRAGADARIDKAIGVALLGTLCVLVPGVVGLAMIGDMSLSAAVERGLLPQLPGGGAKAVLTGILLVAGRSVSDAARR
jgi:biotin transport system substrate-specific component